MQTTSLIALLGAAGHAVERRFRGDASGVAAAPRVRENLDRDATGNVHKIGLFRTEIVIDDGNLFSI